MPVASLNMPLMPGSAVQISASSRSKRRRTSLGSSLPPSYQAAMLLLHSLSSTVRSLSETGVPEIQANSSWPLAANCAIAGPPAAKRLSVAVKNQKAPRSEEHTSELQSLMRISYAVFCLTKKKKTIKLTYDTHSINQ